MIYHSLLGIDFTETGVCYAPVVPEKFTELTRDQVPYWKAQRRLAVKGHNTRIRKFRPNRKPARPFFEASKTGTHGMEIILR